MRVIVQDIAANEFLTMGRQLIAERDAAENSLTILRAVPFDREGRVLKVVEPASCCSIRVQIHEDVEFPVRIDHKQLNLT